MQVGRTPWGRWFRGAAATAVVAALGIGGSAAWAQQTAPATGATGPGVPTVAAATNTAATPAFSAAAAANAPTRRIGSEKRRLAVIPFEFGNIQHWWGNDDWDIGKDMSDLLKTQLVRDGTYSLLERTMLNQILSEQAITQTGLTDPRTAIQVGRLLGVHAVVVGSITQFGFDETNNPGFFGLGRTRNIRAVVAVNVRVVDPTTGEVLTAITARGESAGRGRPVSGKSGQGGINMSRCTFENTYMAEAVNRCVAQIVAELSAAEPRVANSRPKMQGKVADYDATGTVVLNLGAENGVRIGDVFSVERVVRQVRDPDSGRVIRDITEPIGRVTITATDPASSSGKFEPSRPGGETPQVRDAAVRL